MTKYRISERKGRFHVQAWVEPEKRLIFPDIPGFWSEGIPPFIYYPVTDSLESAKIAIDRLVARDGNAERPTVIHDYP